MIKAIGIVFLLGLAGCSTIPGAQYTASPSPCFANEASYACQVERYHTVNVP